LVAVLNWLLTQSVVDEARVTFREVLAATMSEHEYRKSRGVPVVDNDSEGAAQEYLARRRTKTKLNSYILAKVHAEVQVNL